MQDWRSRCWALFRIAGCTCEAAAGLRGVAIVGSKAVRESGGHQHVKHRDIGAGTLPNNNSCDFNKKREWHEAGRCI